MASGYGLYGGRARCHEFWLEFAQCYTKADRPGECGAQALNYRECMTHAGELQRAMIVADHFNAKRRKQIQEAQESAKQASSGNFAALSIPQDPPPAKKEGGGGESKSGGDAKSADAPKAGGEDDA